MVADGSKEEEGHVSTTLTLIAERSHREELRESDAFLGKDAENEDIDVQLIQELQELDLSKQQAEQPVLIVDEQSNDEPALKKTSHYCPKTNFLFLQTETAKIKYIRTKAAPPFSAALVGKPQIFPRPTADPDAAKINASLEENCPLCMA